MKMTTESRFLAARRDLYETNEKTVPAPVQLTYARVPPHLPSFISGTLESPNSPIRPPMKYYAADLYFLPGHALMTFHSTLVQ